VVIVPLDDESDSDVAVSCADQVKQDIASGKRVLGLIGHYNSGQTIAAMDIYKDLPLVIMTPTSSETSLTQKGYTNFFRVNANDATQARVDAAFLVNQLGAKNVAVVHNDDPYGIGLAVLLSNELDRLGAKTATNIQVKVAQSEYLTEVQKIQAANPDAIFYAGYEVETPYLRNALVKAGVTVPFMASDGAFLSATIDESDGTAEGMYLSGFAPAPASVVDKNWIAAYQAVENRNPETYSINGYSAMKALGEAVKKANSIEAQPVEAALHAIDLTTPFGQIAYDANGDLKDQRIYIFQVQKVGDELQFVQVPQ